MRLTPALVVLACAMPLAACAPAAPEPEPAPPGRAWAQPALSFETEEEALAAAMEVYEAFAQVGSTILNEGGRDIERLRPLTTQAWFERETPAYEAFAETGNHTVGHASLIDTKVQSWSDADVSLYSCQDNSSVSVLDSSGEDVTPSDRPSIVTFEVSLTFEGGKLRVDSSSLWSHGTTCF